MRRSWSWTVLWRPTRPSRTNTPKWCPFHYRGLEYKSRKSRSTWSNRQIWPWSMEWSRSKDNRVIPRESTGHSKHPLPTTQEKTLHGHHQMVNAEIRLIISFVAKDGKALYSEQKQDQEPTVAQIMNSLLPNSDWNWRKQGKPLDHTVQFSSVQLLSRVRLFATPWTEAGQAFLSITNSRSSLKLTSIKVVMPSSHLILCRPLLLLPPIPPSIRVFSILSFSSISLHWSLRKPFLSLLAILWNSAFK